LNIKIASFYKKKINVGFERRREIAWRLKRVPRIALIAFQKRVSANSTNISGGRYEVRALDVS